MLFNLFKSKDEKAESDDVIAKISYILTNKSSSVSVDVQMDEYNDDGIENMCELLSTIYSDNSMLETVNIIKNAMINDGQEAYYLKLVNNLTSKYMNHRTLKNEPCVKPSEIIIGR